MVGRENAGCIGSGARLVAIAPPSPWLALGQHVEAGCEPIFTFLIGRSRRAGPRDGRTRVLLSVERWNGKAYQLNRFEYEGKCRTPQQ
jgi:hypothetical protein